MSSINDSCKFILGNATSDEYGVSMAYTFGSTTRSGNVETRNIITSKNTNGYFNLHKVDYDTPLTFDIIIYNTDGSYIDCVKERELKKWLLTNKRQWFQIDQDDQIDIAYYVIGKSANIIDVGAYSGGMLVTFECDTYHAWTSIKEKSYTSNGNLTFSYYGDYDFDDYIVYPQLTITSLANGDISISNTTTNETISIKECKTDEVITIDCNNDKIKSSTGEIMLDRWNKRMIGLIEDVNSINLTGNFELTMQYRCPVRIGA